MKPPARIAIRALPRLTTIPTAASIAIRQIHSTSSTSATVAPIVGAGPPPESPVPVPDSAADRVARKRKQADLLKKAQDIKQSALNKHKNNSALKKRFWKDVHVREVDGMYEVHLDTRPLRRPNNKQIVRLPISKPLLASALALEWDALVSVQQATRQHFIPLTSLVCRALDIADDDALEHTRQPGSVTESIRESIATTLLRYLDTDSLLCWAPPEDKSDPSIHVNKDGETLRDVQKRLAEEVVGFLTTRVWPGVEIEPVLDGESIVPRRQKSGTREVIKGWIMGLNPWELTALERGVLAGKGVLGAARLVVEWSEGFSGAGITENKQFGIEEAAKVASLEVDWQTGRWGEVEDTHDVEKEDVRRQFGGVVLLVSGTGKTSV